MTLGFVVGATALGHAVQQNNGAYNDDAVYWLIFSLVATFAGVLAPRFEALERAARDALPFVFVACVAAQATDLLGTSPAIYIKGASKDLLRPFFVGAGGLVALAAAAYVKKDDKRRTSILGRLHVVLMVGLFLWLGHWILRASPNPWIDVFVFQRDGSAALLHGQNPYAITFPNIYGNGVYYGPGMVANGRVLFGYVYFPLTLLMVLPGVLAFDDPRFAQLAAVAIVAVVASTGRRKSHFGLAAAGLLLTMPRGFFVLEQSWTEPLVLVTLALVVWSVRSKPEFLPYALGLFFASKQYVAMAAPVALMFVFGMKLKDALAFIGKAIATALVVTVPFVLWGPHDFYHSVIELQFYQPFRDDALSVLAWYKHTHAETPPVWLAFAAVLFGGLLSLVRMPRSAAGFAGGIAITLFLFFAFNKQAFCNYYFLVSGSLLLAAGV